MSKTMLEFVSKEAFKKVYLEIVKSPENLPKFFLSLIPNLYRNKYQEKEYSLTSSLGRFSFEIETSGVIVRFSMNKNLADISGDVGRQTLYEVNRNFYHEIPTFSNTGIVDGVYDALVKFFGDSRIRCLIAELEAVMNQNHGTVYRLVKYVGAREEEILRTPKISIAIDELHRLAESIPDEPMALR